MVFVPVPPPSQRLTARARELTDRLEQAIEAYRRQYPGLTNDEIRAALARAAGTTPTPAVRRQALALVVGLLAAAIGGMMVFFRAEGGGAPAPGGGGESAVPMVAVAVGIGVVLLLLVVKLRRREEERD